MFAVKPRMGTAFRILLIAVILFNALTSTAVFAKTSPAQDIKSTETPTQITSETPTPESTPTSADSETPTLEPTDTPTETPTPIAEMATPIVQQIQHTTTDPTNVSQQFKDEIPTLSLYTNPDFVTPGGNLMLNWEIADTSLGKHNFILQINIPGGFSLARQIRGQIRRDHTHFNHPHRDVNGKIHLKSDNTSSEAYIEALILEGDEVIAKASLLVPYKEQFILDKARWQYRSKGRQNQTSIPDGCAGRKNEYKSWKTLRRSSPCLSLSGELLKSPPWGTEQRGVKTLLKETFHLGIVCRFGCPGRIGRRPAYLLV